MGGVSGLKLGKDHQFIYALPIIPPVISSATHKSKLNKHFEQSRKKKKKNSMEGDKKTSALAESSFLQVLPDTLTNITMSE